MAGKRWTETENNLLTKMVNQGLNLHDITLSGKLPNRTPQAITKQIQRLNPNVRQKKLHTGQKIKEAQIADLNTIVKRYIDAFNKICNLTQYTKQDLERFRIIFMAAWKYRDLFREYEKFEEMKVRVERLEKLVEQLLSEKKTEAVEKAA